MEQRAHWNRIGSSYQEEIFDVFKSDQNQLLSKILKKYANPDHTAIDFGCGVGRAFEYLSPSFKSLLALDISDNLLDIARTSTYRNIKFKQHDLTKPLKAKADFGFCCNVIMLPDVDINRTMFKNIRRSVKRAVIVVPSLESFFYSAWQLIEWYKKEGTSPAEIDVSELAGFKGTKADLIQGVVRIDDVKTKHYSQPELEVILGDCDFTKVTINKLEYDWTTEFTSPPKWMKAPYPWDWIIEAE
ncbi:MAG TPA: class I SAM-dependent methyltransferase [Cyclobacteriaceae bacterium]|nr:class I SAM-dependent methyltransferase [Cyclobacteriaceae bacterium]